MSTSTTLITFILRAPEGTFAVELLGSWDNFSKPYKLSRDRRTGEHSWRGCHFFEGITCDGDTSDLSAMRNGGLMMGGTYWYYYRLNSETEYHDPLEPYTSCCPLLPGQPVNVLDVPIQPRRSSGASDSSESLELESLVFTLDPKDKYLPPGVRRARTTSAIQQRKALVRQTSKMPLTTADRKVSDSSKSPPTPGSTRDGPTLRPQRSLISIFDKMRRTKSVGSSTPRATTSWHQKVFSRGSSRAGLKSESSKRVSAVEDIPAVPQVPAHILARERSYDSSNRPSPNMSFRGSVGGSTLDPVMPLGTAMRDLSVTMDTDNENQDMVAGGLTNGQEAKTYPIPDTSLHGNFGACGKPRVAELMASRTLEPPTKSGNQLSSPSENGNLSGHPNPYPNPFSLATDLQTTISTNQPVAFSPTFLDDASELGDQDEGVFGLSSAESSCATDGTFSPEIPANSAPFIPISPMQLSHPETPAISDTDDDTASWRRGSELIDVDIVHLKAPTRAPPLPPSSSQSQAPSFLNPFRIHAPLSGFQGYSLPQDEQGSMHTLRKPASATSFHADHSLHRQASSKDLVHSWNDGSEHRITALEELVDDLGYLGAIIV